MSVSSSSLPKLHQAVRDNDLQTVKRVLAKKLCDVEQLVQWLGEKKKCLLTPMHFAAVYDNIPAAEALLSAGANVNSKGTYNVSPLHLASGCGLDKMVMWLIEHGADVLHKNENGFTALHHAAAEGRVVVGDILLSKGVDINCQDNNGHTPCHYAASYGADKMVPWLLDNGADVHIKCLKGETALDVANRRGHTETARLIQNNINNATTHREILLSQEVRSRTSSNASTVASGTSSQLTIDRSYEMKHITYQGVGVIINNQDFSASGGMLSNRDGSQHDKDKLCAELSVLGLDVHCFVDLTAGTMLNCLTYYSSLDHSQNTCFMCFILTHGSEGKIYGVDGKSVTPLQVTSKFVAATCPSLKGKPKAFVIVACKGKEEIKVDGSVSPDVDAIGACAAPLTPPPSPERESHQLPTDDEERLHEKDLVPLQEEDFLVAFSTIPDHVSYRTTEFGTLYVKWLTKNLSKYGGEHCMADILRNTEKHLVDDVVPNDRSSTGKKQVCYKMYTLKRPFILSGKDMMPKYDESNESETPPGDQN